MKPAAAWIGVIALFFRASAQTPAAGEFEVAEVRPASALPAGSEMVYSTNNAGQPVQIRLQGTSAQVTPVFARGGEVTLRAATMQQLITAAYPEVIREDYVSGGPSWLDSDRFDVIAKAPPGTPVATQRLMLQRLLAKRFHLQVHRENKPMPVFALVVGKSGARLSPAKGSGDPDACPPVHGAAGEGIHRSCHNMTMTVFAQRLPKMASSYIDQPVVDLTGIEGAYDFQLDWSPLMSVDSPGGTTIFVALEKELGLKLEQRRHPMPVVVIDHVDRAPAEN